MHSDIIIPMLKQEVENLVDKILGKNFTVLEKVSGGMMNIAYLLKDKNNKKYIIYIPTEQANEMVDRVLEKSNQNIIYELGITSKNVYFDENTGIKVNEFIEGSSIDKVDDFDYKKLAELFKKLHNSIVLSQKDYSPFVRFGEYEEEAISLHKTVSPQYEELRTFLFKYQPYLESQRLCLSHNDAQRSNIIKTNNGEYYFIDFEFSANNDPIYDISAFGNNLVSEGRKLLEFYFDNNPSENEIKRFYLWRLFISLQWYNVALTKHYRGEGDKHGFNFMDVAEHFLTNAKDAYDGFHLEVRDIMDEKETEKLINSTLDKIRHFLQKDGGDVQFVSFNDGIVYVKMQGACQDCAFANADIKELVEVILQEEVPGVIEVRLAD